MSLTSPLASVGDMTDFLNEGGSLMRTGGNESLGVVETVYTETPFREGFLPAVSRSFNTHV